MGHYPNTALFNNKITPPKNAGAGEWPKLFRENNSNSQGLCRRGGGGVPLCLANSGFRGAAAGRNVNSGDGSSAAGDVIIVGTAVLGNFRTVLLIFLSALLLGELSDWGATRYIGCFNTFIGAAAYGLHTKIFGTPVSRAIAGQSPLTTSSG